MTLRRHRSLLLLALALAAATALVWSDVAVAQQSQTPTELWEEYPLEPETNSGQPTSRASQGSTPKSDGAPTVGDDSGARAAVGERLPVPIFVALAVLVFFLVIGMGVWAASGRLLAGPVLPRRLNREPRVSSGHRGGPRRSGDGRGPSVRDRERPTPASRQTQMGFLGRDTDSRYAPAVPASRQKERAPVAEPAPESGDIAGIDEKPKKPRAPKTRTPATKKQVAHKPRRAKPAQRAKPAKPVRSAKPAPSAKPAQPAKPPQAAQPAQAAKAAQAAKPAKSAKPARPPEQAAPKNPLLAPPPRQKPPTKNDVPAEQGTRSKPPLVDDGQTGTEKMLTCSILWRRNGPVSDFYALSSGLQGHVFVVDRSPEFEWLGGDVPPEAREAHAQLVYTLVRDGWRPLGSKGAWYRQRFERPVGGGRPRTSQR